MLLDPFEEQFNLPARLVERADGGCRQGKLIAQEHQSFGAFGIAQADASQMIGIKPLAVVAVESDRLVADDPGGAIARCRVDATSVEVRLGTGHKKGAGLMQDVEPREIEIPTVHDVDGTGFRDEQVENIDVVQLSV